MPIDAKKHPATYAVFTMARIQWDRALELAMGNTPLSEIKA